MFSAQPSTTPPARPSTREPACSASGIRAGLRSSRAARDGDPEAFDFPVAMERPGLDFSFSGLKTALVYRVRDLGEERVEEATADLAASFQRAIADQLAGKLERAAREGRWPAVALGGGVAANAELRDAGGGDLRRAGTAAEAGPDGALHGQRRDDRLGRQVRGADPVSRLSGLRCLRHW